MLCAGFSDHVTVFVANLRGFIGRRKFSYDVWGDPVNVASRMESSDLPDCIQISERTYELVKDAFVCRPRGTIDIKGKGQMRTWLVEGRRRGQGLGIRD